MGKEKLRKTDAVDCNKLARELRSGSLSLLLISGWSYFPFSCMPNSFGVLLFMSALFFTNRKEHIG